MSKTAGRKGYCVTNRGVIHWMTWGLSWTPQNEVYTNCAFAPNTVITDEEREAYLGLITEGEKKDVTCLTCLMYLEGIHA